MTGLAVAALEYVEQGWSVFPCIPTGPKGKAPLARACPHGHLDATRDPATVRAWWSTYPTALIGAPVPATLLVLDIDPRNGGTMEALCARLGPLPATLTAWSGRGDGGRHLYYRRPTGVLTSTGLPEGIDLKVNGYTILPPSPHPATGDPYVWERREVACLPVAALAGLRPQLIPRPTAYVREGSAGSLAGLTRAVAQASAGSRNKVLYWACRRALEHGQDAAALDQLVAAATAAGLAEREARGTALSAQTAHERDGASR